MRNQAKLNYLRKFNVDLDEETEKGILKGIITVKDVLEIYGKECCNWVKILKPSSDYTPEEHDFFDKYIHNILEIGQERDVVIDYAEDDNEITVQIKHEDVWNDFQRDIGWVDNWYGYYLQYNKLGN